MASPRLPFWIVTEQKHVLNPPANIPCADPTAAHAFTSTEKLTAFLQARDGGRWDVKLVGDHEALVLAIADLHREGVSQMCFDPEPDGSGGLTVSIADVLAACGRGAPSPPNGP